MTLWFMYQQHTILLLLYANLVLFVSGAFCCSRVRGGGGGGEVRGWAKLYTCSRVKGGGEEVRGWAKLYTCSRVRGGGG